MAEAAVPDTHNEGAGVTAISDIKIPKTQKGYSKQEWSGIPNFYCDGCGADTFNENLMIEHVEKVHRA